MNVESIKKLNDVQEYLEEHGYCYHHSAWARGYESRKHNFRIEFYDGRFGHGIKLHTPVWNSTTYHRVHYYIFPF